MSRTGLPEGNVLRRNRSFRRLWFARCVSHIGDGAAAIALLLYVRSIRGTGLAVGALLLAQAIPRLLGPFAGAVADRADKRSLMVWLELGQAVVFGAIAWWQPPFASLLGLVVVASVMAAVFGPAGRSAIPALVGERDLLAANAWLGTAANLQIAVGPFLGGVLSSVFGPRGALAVNAVSFVVSAAILSGLPALRPLPAGEGIRAGVLAVGREGLRYARQDPLVRAIAITLFLGVAFSAVDNVSLVFLTRDVFHASAIMFGVAAGAFGVGMLAGSLGLSAFRLGMGALPLLLLGWLFSGAGTLLTGLAPAMFAVVGAQLVAGLGNGIENIAQDTLIQQRVPPAMLGRVFGLLSTAAFAGSAVAYGLGGLLLDATSPRVTFVVGGIGVFAVFLLMAVVLPRSVRRRATPALEPPQR